MTAHWSRIRAMLEVQGLMVDRMTRRVSARTCRECHAPILAAIAGDVCGIPAYVDPAPLSPLGEALAVLGGRYTCSLRPAPRGLQLDLRDSYHITEAAGSGRYDVVAEHRCGAAPLPEAPTQLRQLPAPTPRKKETSCPF